MSPLTAFIVRVALICLGLFGFGLLVGACAEVDNQGRVIAEDGNPHKVQDFFLEDGT